QQHRRVSRSPSDAARSARRRGAAAQPVDGRALRGRSAARRRGGDDPDGRSSVFPVSRVGSISWTTTEGSHGGTGRFVVRLVDVAGTVGFFAYVSAVAQSAD